MRILKDPSFTSWPIIRYLRLSLVGALIHLFIFCGIVTTSFGVAAAANLYSNIGSVWKTGFGVFWTVWLMMGLIAWVLIVLLGNFMTKESLHRFYIEPAARVIAHLILLSYHLFRFSFFVGMMAIGNEWAMAIGYTLEFDLCMLALAIAIPIITVGGLSVCFGNCRRQLRLELESV